MRSMRRFLSVGIEVDRVEDLGKSLDGVVTAKVESFVQHPNADRLRLCQVSDGSETFQIVCGAKNFEAGDVIALSNVGAVLPNGMKIKKSKIRGEESFGMICSESELGLSEESEGILVLDKATKLGSAFGASFGAQRLFVGTRTHAQSWGLPKCSRGGARSGGGFKQQSKVWRKFSRR